MQSKRVLFILTGHDRLGDATDTAAGKTGFHLAEAARPWRVLTEAGYEVDLATPRGGPAPIDPSSRDMDDEDNVKFLDDPRMKKQLADTLSLADADTGVYAAVYFPGGHGTMWDLPDDRFVQDAARSMYEAGKVVGAVCHGPAALVNVRLSDGNWLVDGKTLSVFTDEEEKAVGKNLTVPFLLASRLEEHGAKIAKADNFNESVTVDGHLVTGQNPASARGVGERMRDLLNERQARAA